jgi:hypothetical protein
MARHLALPGALDLLAVALKLPYRKDSSFNIRQVALPRRARVAQGEDPAQVYCNDSPELLGKLYAYWKRDVETLRAAPRRCLS